MAKRGRPTQSITVSNADAKVTASVDGIAITSIASGPTAVQGREVVFRFTTAEAAAMLPRLIDALAKSVDLAKLHEF